jgi:hypothetical protein
VAVLGYVLNGLDASSWRIAVHCSTGMADSTSFSAEVEVEVVVGGLGPGSLSEAQMMKTMVVMSLL